jgi:hypothetical protein
MKSRKPLQSKLSGLNGCDWTTGVVDVEDDWRTDTEAEAEKWFKIMLKLMLVDTERDKRDCVDGHP